MLNIVDGNYIPYRHAMQTSAWTKARTKASASVRRALARMSTPSRGRCGDWQRARGTPTSAKGLTVYHGYRDEEADRNSLDPYIAMAASFVKLCLSSTISLCTALCARSRTLLRSMATCDIWVRVSLVPQEAGENTVHLEAGGRGRSRYYLHLHLERGV